MKKCPNCQRTFDDSMRFCQTDGTALVDDVPVDPYKTMVASSDEIAAAMNPPADPAPAAKIDEEVLQLPPDNDPKKTMFVSEEEMRRELGVQEEPVVDLPPLAPEPPRFSEPSLSPPSFGDAVPSGPAPPPSPLAEPPVEEKKEGLGDLPFMKTTPPIPSPFDKQKESSYDRPSYYTPREPAAGGSPLESASAPIGAGASAPIQSSEPVKPMQNAPVSAGPAGQSKTLAIVSLVTGILGFLCCGLLFPSLLAIILGVIARGKASKDPANYGGSGLAVAGIITGVLGLIGGIAYLIWLFAFGGLQILVPNQGF